MAFTNIWDITYPPDTQLANLLGQDIRNGVKVDVQQRMASISGLDAAKPRFDLDAQPNNWNGILFFAIDSGRIYQFNNPVWTEVTTAIVHSHAVKVNGAQFVNGGTQPLNFSGVAAGSIVRVSVGVQQLIGGPVAIALNFNGGPPFITSPLTSSSTGDFSKLRADANIVNNTQVAVYGDSIGLNNGVLLNSVKETPLTTNLTVPSVFNCVITGSGTTYLDYMLLEIL